MFLTARFFFKTLPFALLLAATAFTSCSKKGCTDPKASNYNPDAKKDDNSCRFDFYDLEQKDLDAVKQPVQLEITGYSEQEAGFHGGGNTIRDVFANFGGADTASISSIVAMRAFAVDQQFGGRDSAQGNIYVMVKHEAGYFPEGGDYEYLTIPIRANNNWTANPNGLYLLNSTRGKDSECAGCHKAAPGKDFLFTK